MKTAKEWMTELSKVGKGHARVRELDIVQIQIHTLHWAASQIITDGNPGVARDKIMREILRVAEPQNDPSSATKASREESP